MVTVSAALTTTVVSSLVTSKVVSVIDYLIMEDDETKKEDSNNVFIDSFNSNDVEDECKARIFDELGDENKNLWWGVSVMNEEEKRGEKRGKCGRVGM